jgi:hypothetical protein
MAPSTSARSSPTTEVAWVRRGEAALDLPFGAHRAHKEGHPDRAGLLGPPTVDVGGERRTAQVLPLQFQGDAGPVRLELGLALTRRLNRGGPSWAPVSSAVNFRSLAYAVPARDSAAMTMATITMGRFILSASRRAREGETKRGSKRGTRSRSSDGDDK